MLLFAHSHKHVHIYRGVHSHTHTHTRAFIVLTHNYDVFYFVFCAQLLGHNFVVGVLVVVVAFCVTNEMKNFCCAFDLFSHRDVNCGCGSGSDTLNNCTLLLLILLLLVPIGPVCSCNWLLHGLQHAAGLVDRVVLLQRHFQVVAFNCSSWDANWGS